MNFSIINSTQAVFLSEPEHRPITDCTEKNEIKISHINMVHILKQFKQIYEKTEAVKTIGKNVTGKIVTYNYLQ